MLEKNPAVDEWLESLPEERKAPCAAIRDAIVEHLPEGFVEVMSGAMPNYVVPLSRFPAGYHCSPNTPLPFLSFASQKNFIALYHFGMYVDQELMAWFTEEYPRHVKTKLDMGKSCIRFKKMETIPYGLIGELASKRSVDQWLSCYKEQLGIE